MSKFKWYTYQNETRLVEKPAEFNAFHLEDGAILMASCFSKNGYYGCVWIIKQGLWYYLQAGSNDTGNLWKSPDDLYPTIEQAVNVAESLWRPI